MNIHWMYSKSILLLEKLFHVSFSFSFLYARVTLTLTLKRVQRD